MAAVVPSASNTYSNSFIFAVPVFILEAASFLIGELFIFLSFCFQAPHHKGAGSEGEDVPVGTEGDGDGGDDAEGCECHFKKFHFISGRFLTVGRQL